ncbi:hypothetical protein Tco_0009389 [Tanacetum coccineum]
MSRIQLCSSCELSKAKKDLIQDNGTVPCSKDGLNFCFIWTYVVLCVLKASMGRNTLCVTSSSSPTDNSTQQDTQPTENIYHTTEPVTPTTTVTAEENNTDNQAAIQVDNAHVDDNEFYNIFNTPVHHPLSQVHGNPSKPVQTRQQLATDPETCTNGLPERLDKKLDDGVDVVAAWMWWWQGCGGDEVMVRVTDDGGWPEAVPDYFREEGMRMPNLKELPVMGSLQMDDDDEISNIVDLYTYVLCGGWKWQELLLWQM